MKRFLFGTKGVSSDVGILGLFWYNLCQIDWVIFFVSMFVGAFLVGAGMFVGWVVSQ